MKRTKILAIVIVVFTIMLSSFSFYAYQIIFTPNILVDMEDRLFAIYPGATFKDVQNQLYDGHVVNDLVSFSFLARVKSYDELVKPGMYLLKKDMSNNDAINLLRSGRQAPVRLTFSNARKLEELPAKLTMTLALDSAEMASFMLSDSIARNYGFTKETFISMFLPNTYEMYWTASAKDILDRLESEYDRYWSEERLAKAEALGLSPVQVSTLASIVDSETNLMDEAPTIAGVYLNRIKKGYPLQADPTLVFALNDFTIRRVLDVHKSINSPYNTYKYRGLPPGPIMMPSIAALEAVLNAEDHSYLYFCAKEDFSGYHVFAKTLIEHNANARRFQQALNRQRIYR